MLFRMVPKRFQVRDIQRIGFRAVLFRMVPKPVSMVLRQYDSFRAVLFRMVPKLQQCDRTPK